MSNLLTNTIKPSVCPGCGKCNTCGRPYEVSPTPAPAQPYWPSQPQITWGNDVQIQGGQNTAHATNSYPEDIH